MPTDDLPDFLELHTFAVAARWMHLGRAASELNVTPGAVSQRIKQLETRLGAPLFVRNGRALELTAAGHAVRLNAEALIAQRRSLFGAPLQGGRQRAQSTVIVNTTPSLARGWLMPRLARFAGDCPGILLRLVCSLAFTRFRDSHAEIALRYGAGGWPQVSALRLLDDWIYPVAAPSMAAEWWPEAEDWSRAPLLEDLQETWTEWFAAQGRTGPPARLQANDASVLLDACEQGLGVALLRHRVIATRVASGALVRLPGPALACRHAHWLVTPLTDTLAPAAREARQVVSEWLCAQAEASDGPPG